MKYFILCFFFVSPVFAQPRCESIFEDLARMHVDIENTSNSLVRNTLNREYQKRRRAALNAGIDLTSLNQKIQDLRDGNSASEKAAEILRKDVTKKENLLLPFTKKASWNVGSNFAGLKFIADDKVTFGSARHTVYNTQTGQKLIPNLTDRFGVITSDGKLYLTRPPAIKAPEIYKLETKEIFFSLEHPQQIPGYYDLPNISDNGHFAAVVFRTKENKSLAVLLWDLQTRQFIGEIPLKDDHVRDFKLSNDGSRVSVYDGNEFVIYDTVTQKIIQQLPFPLDYASKTKLELNHDGSKALILTVDKVVLWNLVTQQTQVLLTNVSMAKWSLHSDEAVLYGDRDEVYGNPQRNFTVLGFDGDIPHLRPINVGSFEILSAAINHNGNKIAIQTKNGFITIYEREEQ